MILVRQWPCTDVYNVPDDLRTLHFLKGLVEEARGKR